MRSSASPLASFSTVRDTPQRSPTVESVAESADRRRSSAATAASKEDTPRIEAAAKDESLDDVVVEATEDEVTQIRRDPEGLSKSNHVS